MIKIIEFFGGVGAATIAAKKLFKENVEIVDYVEIDNGAVKTYNAINGTNFKPTDINDVDVKNYPEVDLLVAGWPCQDFSISGKNLGLDGDRSNLILTTIRKVKEMKHKPKYILLENVKGLTFKKHENDLLYIKELFKEMGYNWSHVVLNSKNFGIPQNRERLFMLLSRNDETKINIEELKNYTKEMKPLKEYLDLSTPAETFELKPDNHLVAKNYINFRTEGLNQTLVNSQYLRYWDINKYIGTIPATNPPKIFYNIGGNKIKYRKITALEAWRLMTLGEENYNKVKDILTEYRLLFQAGNSIVVEIIEKIMEEIWDV